MKAYSEITQKFYDTFEEAEEAEKAALEVKARAEAEKKARDSKRAERAKEVEAAHKELREAEKKYSKLLNQFIRDYGSYHMTYTDSDKPLDNIFDAFYTTFGL